MQQRRRRRHGSTAASTADVASRMPRGRVDRSPRVRSGYADRDARAMTAVSGPRADRATPRSRRRASATVARGVPPRWSRRRVARALHSRRAMLTTRRLRRILMHAALGAVPFIAPAVPAVTTAVIAVGSAGCCGESIESHDLLVPIAGAGYDALIEMCALDDLKCEALCAAALRAAGLNAPGPDEDGEDDGGHFTACVMTAHDDDFVKLETTVVTPPGGCGRRP